MKTTPKLSDFQLWFVISHDSVHWLGLLGWYFGWRQLGSLTWLNSSSSCAGPRGPKKSFSHIFGASLCLHMLSFHMDLHHLVVQGFFIAWWLACQREETEATSSLKAWTLNSQNATSATFYWSKQAKGPAQLQGKENRFHPLMWEVAWTYRDESCGHIWRPSTAFPHCIFPAHQQ